MQPHDAPTVHIVGLGLAGLSAAVRLAEAGQRIVLYEAAGHAGGRCRSFHDARLGIEIDNGNHLLLSGNTSALAYTELLGSRDRLEIFADARFPFADLKSGERWSIDLGSGRAPWWLFDPARRVRGASLAEHLGAARILLAGEADTVCDRVPSEGALFERFWEPLTIAVLNTRPERGSATLLRKVLLETFGRGGRNARPMIARQSLGDVFVAPALARLAEAGVPVHFHSPLRAVAAGDRRVERLHFDGNEIALGPQDRAILALSPSRLATVIEGIEVPQDDTVIANAHFRLPETDGDGRVDFLGLVNAQTHWIFRRPGLISTTISAAHEMGLARVGSEPLLDLIWAEIRTALALPESVVPTARRLIREKRATFDQSPAGVRSRPGTTTSFENLFLAGDFVDTGLPATIEGAIRSGETAAAHCLPGPRNSRTDKLSEAAQRA